MTVFLKSWIFSTGAASRVLPLHTVHIPFLHSMVRVRLTNAKNSFQISVYNKLSTRDLSLIKKIGSKAEDAKRSSLVVTRRGCIRNKSITGTAQVECFGDKVRRDWSVWTCADVVDILPGGKKRWTPQKHFNSQCRELAWQRRKMEADVLLWRPLNEAAKRRRNFPSNINKKGE